MSLSRRRLQVSSPEYLEARYLLHGSVDAIDVAWGEVANPNPARVVYVDNQGGSNDNSGATPDAPVRSLFATLHAATPGTTIYVFPGFYYSPFYGDVPGGTSWDAAVRIAAYDPNNRPVISAKPGWDRVITLASSDSKYIEIDGLVLDATNASKDAVKISWSGSGASHHIRIKNSEIKNAPGVGVLTSEPEKGVSHLEFINVDVHHNGLKNDGTGIPHGFYITTPYTLVENSRVHNNAGWGIHNYGDDPDHNVYRYNTVEDNGRLRDDAMGIGVYSGKDIHVYGNTVKGSHYGGIDVDWGAKDVVVRGNEVTDSVVGIRVGATRTANVIVVDNRSVSNTTNVDGLSNMVEFGMVEHFIEPAMQAQLDAGPTEAAVGGPPAEFCAACLPIFVRPPVWEEPAKNEGLGATATSRTRLSAREKTEFLFREYGFPSDAIKPRYSSAFETDVELGVARGRAFDDVDDDEIKNAIELISRIGGGESFLGQVG